MSPSGSQVAVLAGGYGGMGRVVSAELAAAGYAVAIAGRSAENAEKFAAELSGQGHTAAGYAVDIADMASVASLVSQVTADLGGIDLLVNLAASPQMGPAADITEEQWQRTLDVNLTGAFRLSQAVGRYFIAAGQPGRIIHFSSTRAAAGAVIGFAAYGASKAGLELLVKQLATEWAPYQITVNAIAPGFIPTGLTPEAESNPGFLKMMLKRIPLGRFGQPEEIAAAVVFLASPNAGFITGQTLYVDGGVTASS